MNFKKLLLAGSLTLSVAAAASANPADDRPVLQAALQATPTKRHQAVEFVRKAYPSLPQDLYAQLKASFPDLEHDVVDAGLATWERHPGEVMAIAQKAKAKFGSRITTLRTAVRQELESSYPDFRNRLETVLSEHGRGQRFQKFIQAYDPELLPALRKEAGAELPESKGWYPGKFRQMWLNSKPGENPGFDRLRGIVQQNPGLAPKLAAKMVHITRQRDPHLAEDLVKNVLDNRGELREALNAEFPGIKEKVVAVVERVDSKLPGEVATFARAEAAPLRADFKAALEKEMPGFEGTVRHTLQSRYPDLQQQLLRILKG